VSGSIDSYLIISRALVENRLTPQEFETVFLSVFRGEGDLFPTEVTEALHSLFTAVDIYYPDPDIRESDGLDDAGLIAAAEMFLRAVEGRNG
jgi:hypothetical protein